jgi:predicted MFS family arabinose efflux permease
MFLAFAIVFALVAARALGAQLTRLSLLRLRATGLVFVALAVQIVIFTGLSSDVPSSLDTALHRLTYLLLLAFLFLNRRQPGLWISGVGLAANTAAIFANGGRMPISLRAWTTTGRAASSLVRHGFHDNNVLAGPHTPLAWLGDVFALPSIVPFATAFSVGDVLILFGAIAFVCRGCAPPGATSARQLLDPLRFDGFRRLLIGRGASTLGDLLTMTAVVTWLFERTHSTAQVSAVLIARIVATTLGGMIAAPLLDRLPGFRTLSIIELSRGLLTLCAVPLALDRLVIPLVAVVCLSALVGAATNPRAASLVPELLPADLLNRGNALHGLIRNFVMVVGAAAGSFAVVRLGIGGALLLDVATFCIAAALYLRFSGRPYEAPTRGPANVSHRELLRALFSSRLVLGLTASFAVVTAAMGLLNATLPAFFSTALRQPASYGYALATIGAGLMLGELLTGFVDAESVARRSVGVAFTLSAAAVFVLGHSTAGAPAYLMLLLLGSSDGTTEVVRDTLFQRYLPQRLRAGVFAISGSLQNAGMVLGLALAPVLEALTTGTHTLNAVALGCLVGAGLAAVALLKRPTGTTLPGAETATAPVIGGQ